MTDNHLILNTIYNILFKNDYNLSINVLFNKLSMNQKSTYKYIINETDETINYRKIPLIFDNDNKKNKNIEFYNESIPALGNKESHKHYFTDILQFSNKNLEDIHTYIQWLFPNRIKSKYNPASVTLQQEEINVFKTDEKIKSKIIKSIVLMLNFYGFDINNGVILKNYNSNERFDNLIKKTHNNLRISRILYFLGDLDMIDYQYSFLDALYTEIFKTKKLKPLKESFIKYWIHTIKDDNERNNFKIKVLETIINEK